MKKKSIGDCNWTRTHNHLVRKQTLNETAEDELEDIALGIPTSRSNKIDLI